MKKEKAMAILTIMDTPRMTDRGHRQIAAWLQKQANSLMLSGKNYAPKFRARYLYLLLLFSIPLRAQTIQLNAAFEPSSVPRSSGVLLYIYGSGDTRPYTAITMRPIGIEGVTFSASAGVLRRLASGIYRIPGSTVDRHVFLESFGQAGIATSGAATSGIFNGGGSLVFPTPYGVAWVLSGEAVVAPVNKERQAKVSLGLRFNFQ